MTTPVYPNFPIDWDFRLGNIYFNTQQEPDDLGCQWVMPTPDGWDSPDFRATSNPIPFEDGADVDDGYQGGRIIHGTGHIQGPTVAAIEQAKRRMTATLRAMDRADGRFWGHMQDAPRGYGNEYCTVRTAGKLAFPERLGPTAITFDFMVVAGDPRKYSETSRTVVVDSSTAVGGALYPMLYPVLYSVDPGTLPATDSSTNSGTAPAPLIATFYGPLERPTVVDRFGGLRIPLKASVPAGRSVVVNTAQQTVMSDDGTFVYAWYDDSIGTPLRLLAIPPATDVGVGHADWVLLGNGAGRVEITNQDVSA